MGGKTQDEARLARYFLGELDGDERDALEEAFFTDEEAFEQALAAEDELFDAYARGELSAAERERFEAVFLSRPRGRQRLHFARALADATAEAGAADAAAPAAVITPARPPFFEALRARGAALRFALAGVALLLAVGSVWLLYERSRAGGELRRLREESAALRERVRELEQQTAAERTRSEELLARLEGAGTRPTPEAAPPAEGAPRADATPPGTPARRQQPPPSAVAFTLTPGLVRAGGGRTLAVPPAASSVALRLGVESNTFESYRAVIETADGREVWRADVPAPRGATLSLPALPARTLPPGDYVLLLTGKRPDGGYEGAADYSFRVVRK